ncbi:MAG: hypothetical protein SGILL_006984 [Bacillariaceae sp.]
MDPSVNDGGEADHNKDNVEKEERNTFASPSKVIYDEESMSVFRTTETRPKRKRRISSPIKGTKVCQSEEDLIPASTSEKESSDDDDDEYSDTMDDGRLPAKKQSKKSRSKENPASCDHCGKEFTTVGGLKYHVDKRVCRIKTESNAPAARDAKAKPKKRKRAKSETPAENEEPGAKKTKWKRFRGPEEKRKCERCGRIFTSSLGLKYHLENKVCRSTVGTTAAKHRPGKKVASFHTLEKGEEFVTPFGVVRVIKDDRAVPTASEHTPKEVAVLNKQQRNAVSRFEGQVSRYQIQRFAQLRRRREKINELYKSDKVSQKSIFDAYSDTNAERMIIVAPEDPFSPPDAFPDRIVECLWIADKRTYFDHNAEEQETRFQSMETPVKLFLRRHLLKEEYLEDGVVYNCEACGKTFNSHPSWSYHTRNKPCQNQAQTARKRRDVSEKRIVTAMQAYRTNEVKILAPPKKRVYPKKKPKRLNYGMYPEVLIGLGFKLVAADEGSKAKRPALERKRRVNPTGVDSPVHAAAGSDSRSARLAARQRVNVQAMDLEAVDPEIDATIVQPQKRAKIERKTQDSARKPDEDPRIVLKQLRQEHLELCREIDSKKYGSMYPEVYESLGFYFPGTFPRTECNIVTVQRVVKKKKKRKRKRATPMPPPILPLAPVVDHKALVDEVLSGRYPSMKPFEGAHKRSCSVCKKEGSTPLLYCNFCNQTEHLECLRTKFTTKAPEPGEDFMCHKCIGIIISRRNRAEKRRLGAYSKEKESEEKNDEEAVQSTEDTKNNEYKLVAARGKETNELVELLTDARSRLKQSIRQVETNNLRRRMLMS